VRTFHLVGLALRVVLAGALIGTAVALVANGVALADQTARITDAGYDPQIVTIHAGESVVWVNDGAVAHTVTADDGTFDSGAIAPGGQWGVTLTEVGTFNIHSTAGGFQGRVEVLGIDVTNAPEATVARSGSPLFPGAAGDGSGDPSPTAILIVVAVVGILIGVAYGYSRRAQLPSSRRR
jgi:plastocyanin